ncbi:MAG: cation transporter, partial [Planctomycetota bacterium]
MKEREPAAPATPSPGDAGARALSAAAWLSAVLALGKFAVGLATGSLAVLASAADSFADALMSAANGWGYRQARVPADEDHPFGHGKWEGALAVGQGTLLLGIVGGICVSAALALIRAEEVRWPLAGVAVLLVSGISSGLLTFVLGRVRGRSVVVAADAAHYRIDLAAAAAGVAGLLLVRATGRHWIDPLLGLGAAALMARECAGVLRKGLAELLDESLPPAELSRLEAILAAHRDRYLDLHGLRTRRSGPVRFIEVHLVFPAEAPLGAVHRAVQDIGDSIREAFPGSRVLVHPDAAGH